VRNSESLSACEKQFGWAVIRNGPVHLWSIWDGIPRSTMSLICDPWARATMSSNQSCGDKTKPRATAAECPSFPRRYPPRILRLPMDSWSILDALCPSSGLPCSSRINLTPSQGRALYFVSSNLHTSFSLFRSHMIIRLVCETTKSGQHPIRSWLVTNIRVRLFERQWRMRWSYSWY
jgi:hypothetical protein